MAHWIKQLLAVALALTFTSPAWAETISIWGSTTCQKVFLEPGKSLLEQDQGVKIRIVAVGTGKGLVALIHGKADAAAASSNLESSIKSAEKEIANSQLTLSIPDNLMFHEIYTDKISTIVHPSNPVKKLSNAQLKKIFTGQIDNWALVGGNDQKIDVVISGHAGSATRAVFRKQILNGDAFYADAKKVINTRESVFEVARNPNAISMVSQKFMVTTPGVVTTIQTGSLTRPLAIITLGEPSAAVQKMIDFYTSGPGTQYF